MTAPVTVTPPLPCPFCGGEATLNERLRDGYRFVECESCAFGLCAERTEAEAIAAWNTRTQSAAASDAQVAELREALEKAQGVLRWAEPKMARLDDSDRLDRAAHDISTILARAKATSDGEGV